MAEFSALEEISIRAKWENILERVRLGRQSRLPTLMGLTADNVMEKSYGVRTNGHC